MSAGDDPRAAVELTPEPETVLYSRGVNTYDAFPEQRSAATFEAFADAVLSDRSKAKGLAWISAPFKPNSDGRHHRCGDGVRPRRFLAIDQDGGTRQGLVDLCTFLSGFRGFGYTTSSHTTANPHSRHVLELSRPVDRPEGIRLGEALQRQIEARVGHRVIKLDPSTFRGEQPCFGPLVGADVMRYDGCPVDVDAVLATAPKEEPRVHRADEPDPYRAALLERGLVLRELGPGKDAIACPFSEDHSEATSDTSTVYFWPRHGGYQWGGIHCLHAHCAERNKAQRLYIEKLGLDPREVWREQRGGAAPSDDLPPVEAYEEAAQEGARQHTASAKAGLGAGAVKEEVSSGEEWPEMDPCAYYGIAGEAVNAIGPHTESDPVALLAQILTAFGVLVGRSPYMQVEGDRHYPNLFDLLIGETSKGRKGTSWGRVRSIFERVHSWPRVVSGLSSGEGLKWQVRDKRTEMVKDKKSGATSEEVVDEGVEDKRLLVIEPEFAQVLRVVARHGNTLSSTTRTAWDTGNLATLTKNDPVTATDAHIAIIGHVTVDELRAELTQTDTANGFANRFLFVCVKRSKCLPFGGADLPESVLSKFLQQIEQAASSARRVGGVVMAQSARDIWERVYPQLSEGVPGLFGAATARGEAQVLRLAMLYALLDEKAQIDGPHLLAALAVWEYAEASARYVFGSSLGDPVADEILRAVRAAGQEGMTRTQIRDLFKRNCSAERIGAALDLLARRNSVRRRTQETGGRPSEVWVSV